MHSPRNSTAKSPLRRAARRLFSFANRFELARENGGEIAFGATYGREVWWRPEVRLGYRQTLAGEVGDTVFRFSGGQWVTLPASEAGEGAAVIGFSLKTGSATSYVAVEGEYEAAEGEDRYNLMLAGRVIF